MQWPAIILSAVIGSSLVGIVLFVWLNGEPVEDRPDQFSDADGPAEPDFSGWYEPVDPRDFDAAAHRLETSNIVSPDPERI